MNSDWKEYQQKNKDRFLNELIELLRIPSVSARSEHKDDMLTCANAMKQKLCFLAINGLKKNSHLKPSLNLSVW